MTILKCPKCRSSRIRRGYKRAPLPLRLFGIHYLLCDHCNLLFTGFVLPGTLKSHRKKHRHHKESQNNTKVSAPTVSARKELNLSTADQFERKML